MIEKNIRLQPHHSRDLLVGRRSDGRRPKYQPPSQGGGFANVGGGGGGGGGASHDRGGQQHAAQAAAAQRAEADRQTRVAEQAAAERKRVIQAENIRRASELVNRNQTGGVTLGEGMTGVPESIDFATARRLMTQPGWAEDATVYDPYGIKTPSGAFTYDMNYKTSDQGPVTRGGGPDVIPEFVPRKTTTVTGGIPHTEGPIDRIVYEPREGPARTYDPRTDPNALLQRGSGIMGTAKDKATQMAKDFAQRKVMKALGLGAFNPFLGVGSWLLDKFAPGAKAKLTSKFKYTRPKTDTQEEATKKLVKHEPVDRDGQQETTIQEAVAGKKSLGIDFEDIRKKQSIMKTALDEGWYLDNEGRRIQLTDQQKEMLTTYITRIDKYLVDPTAMAAYGGRIDKALGGRSRDIG